MVIQESVKVYGGNGLCGMCTTCEELVPVFQIGERWRCLNHGGDNLAAPRQLGSTRWTRTKVHKLVLLPSGEAFCRACRSVMTPTHQKRPRCPVAATGRGRAQVEGRAGVLEPRDTPSQCRSCGTWFPSLGLFDAHRPCPSDRSENHSQHLDTDDDMKPSGKVYESMDDMFADLDAPSEDLTPDDESAIVILQVPLTVEWQQEE